MDKELQKGNSRKLLMEVVETRDEAAWFFEVVATEVEGEIRGGGIFSGGTNAAPAGVTTPRKQEVTVVRLTIRGQVYATDFLGVGQDLLRPPVTSVSKQIERWVEVNFQVLHQALAGAL